MGVLLVGACSNPNDTDLISIPNEFDPPAAPQPLPMDPWELPETPVRDPTHFPSKPPSPKRLDPIQPVDERAPIDVPTTFTTPPASPIDPLPPRDLPPASASSSSSSSSGAATSGEEPPASSAGGSSSSSGGSSTSDSTDGSSSSTDEVPASSSTDEVPASSSSEGSSSSSDGSSSSSTESSSSSGPNRDQCLPDESASGDAPVDADEPDVVDDYDGEEMPQVGGCADDSMEPNDGSAQAAAIQAGSFELKSCGDDWFRMTVPAGNALVATLEFLHEQSDLDLYAYVGEDTETPVQGSDGIMSQERVHPGPFTTDTTVYLRVRNFGGEAADYTLVVDLAPTPANNTCEGAPEIHSGQTVTGSTFGADSDVTFNTRACTGFVDSGKDVFYQVTIPAGGKLTATVTSDADLALYLVASCDARCCWGGVDDMDAEMDETLVYENITGAQQVLMLGVDGWSPTTAGDFSLTVTVE